MLTSNIIGKDRQHIDIMWTFAVARALLLAQLNEKDIIELHERENTTAKRHYGHYEDYKQNPIRYPNWLLAPFEIQRLFPMKIRHKSANEGEMKLMIELMSKQIPSDIDIENDPELMPWPSHSGSINWQHSWDWRIFHNVTLLDLDMKKKNKLSNDIENWQDRENQ